MRPQCLGHIYRTRSAIDWMMPSMCKRYAHKAPSNDQPWSQAIPYDVAERMLVDYDARIEAARTRIRSAPALKNLEPHAYELLLSTLERKETEVRENTDRQARVISGRNMPSSVMQRLNIKFYADIRRRRQHHGLRVQVLYVLAELRHLLHSCAETGDRSGRVFVYLEALNEHYTNALRHHAPVLQLRSANTLTLGMRDGQCGPTIVVAAANQQQRMTTRSSRFTSDTACSPLFDRTMYSKRRRREFAARINAVDPRVACWVDYLINDLTEPESHALFRLVARSKVPEQTQPKYRAAIEEALALAFNRRAYALDPLESMRVCVYFLRQLKQEDDEGAVHFRQICAVWRHVGHWCNGETVGAVGELRFKRWNNVASEALAWHVQGDMQGACELLAEWHATWTRVMHVLCPGGGRREFVDGTDPFAFPFWRPKQPDVLRLHELTLSTHAINSILMRMAHFGLADCAAEILGLATSEIGVHVSASMFNIVLNGLAVDAGPWAGPPLPQLRTLLVPTNAHALDVYKTDGNALAQVMTLLRGMVRWNMRPDAFTLYALMRFCCGTDDLKLLRSVLEAFDTRWQIEPSPQCWRLLAEYGLDDQVRSWMHNVSDSDFPLDP
ncbi:hypothetical protein GGH98_001369 [Coemansia sp. RSA 454]|nr:hypothetical protein GGH98_001369 [Coemansia sp. RSA 454]